MGIRVDPPRRAGDADDLHQRERALAGLPPAVAESHERRLRDLIADAHHGIESRHRLLEDHRHRPTSKLAKPISACTRHVDTVELDRSRSDSGGTREQADQRTECHRLAGAGLTDDAERLTRPHLERCAVHGAQRAARERELDRQVADAQQWLGHSGLSRSASPSASSERPSAVITTAMPGTVESSQFVVR